MSENYVNATLSDLNDLTNAILSNPDVQSTLETKPELRQIAKSAVDRPVITKDSRTWNGRQTMISYGPLNEGQWTLLQKVDQSVLFEDARKIGAWTIWTFLIALMLGWMVSYRLSDTIRRSLLQLSRLMAVDGNGFGKWATGYGRGNRCLR
ncbi:hypothetical protein JDW19_03690 [Paenibacillus polymyxa]|uniref:Uncharacterized protein n=2 Tax=Paenibacillus TaxID=44249 RepID=A0A8I1IXP7_PAEPO|nr:hypothetical protein [Paenibacillus polymyxa]